MVQPLLFTMGHSTLSIEEFIRRMQNFAITIVVDIRTIPKSRHNPQFEKETLARSLNRVDISYLHVKELGGLRKPLKESVNSGWRNTSFRGYADYMQTPKFQTAREGLIELAKKERVVIVCAEA